MPLHKPDVCFTSKNQKTFNFNNSIAILKLNEVYDKCYFIPSIKDLSNKTIIIDTDKDSDKVIAYYLLLKDKIGLDSIIISSPEGVDIIWEDESIEMENDKNYIIQFKQINDATILASLTNSTLTFSKEKPVPPPPVPPEPEEISAIYFAMPEEGTLLYDMFTWYDEFKKSGETPAGALEHEESIEFFVPQITNNVIEWKSFTDYTIEDNMIKVLVKDIDEESFLKTLNTEYISFFNLHVIYEAHLKSKQNIQVNYPLIWGIDDKLGNNGHIALLNSMYYTTHSIIGIKTVYDSVSCVKLYDMKSQQIASIEGLLWHGDSYKWGSNNNASLYPDNSVKINNLNNVENNSEPCITVGFILNTNKDGAGTETSIDHAAEFFINGMTSTVNNLTKKSYMPYGDMTLSYVKFEYKDVNN